MKWTSKELKILAGIGAGLLGAGWLYNVDPTQCAFFPKCPTYYLFKLYCPGCGAARALHALLHGQWRQALAYNVFLTLLLPWFLGLALLHTYAAFSKQPRPAFMQKNYAEAAWVLVIALLLFTILRNCPGPCANYLAPHILP